MRGLKTSKKFTYRVKYSSKKRNKNTKTRERANSFEKELFKKTIGILKKENSKLKADLDNKDRKLKEKEVYIMNMIDGFNKKLAKQQLQFNKEVTKYKEQLAKCQSLINPLERSSLPNSPCSLLSEKTLQGFPSLSQTPESYLFEYSRSSVQIPTPNCQPSNLIDEDLKFTEGLLGDYLNDTPLLESRESIQEIKNSQESSIFDISEIK